MTGKALYESMAKRTGGDVYIGVIGPVRTGKSTFIKRFMETMVLPNIEDEEARARARDELPQSASGKTVMTAEPKFVPEEGVRIHTGDGAAVNVRMVDCVGYLVDGALGGEEGGAARMVQTPWREEKLEFSAAAKLGTDKVMREHATVGVVVTTDGSIGEIPRENYLAAEREIIETMQTIGKPFAVLCNCADPHSEGAQAVGKQIEQTYGVPVALCNCTEMDAADMDGILSLLLAEFPILRISVDLPAWICALPQEHPCKAGLYRAIRAAAGEVEKVSEVRRAFEMGIGEETGAFFESAETDLSGGEAVVKLHVPEETYFSVLSELTGTPVTSAAELFAAFCDLAATKTAYDKVETALREVGEKGYGIVLPQKEELTLSEPQIVKTANGYGVRLRAKARSVHMIRADIEAEVSPIVGSETQAEEMVRTIKTSLAESPETIWETGFFGQSLYDLVRDGLAAKLRNIPESSQKRLSETLERVINEGSGGLICIIL